MKKILLAAALLALAGCGNSSADNEVTGQVKKVLHITPLICPDYDVADISLGVMRNGTGSMSKEDLLVYIPEKSDAAMLAAAAQNGDIVRLNYSVWRVTWCHPDHHATSVSIDK